MLGTITGLLSLSLGRGHAAHSGLSRPPEHLADYLLDAIVAISAAPAVKDYGRDFLRFAPA